jgi:hypothetical protein
MNSSAYSFLIISVTLVVTVALAQAFMTAVRVWAGKKRAQTAVMPGYDPEAIARLQASVDAISIEVERISEGQRFTTKLLNERVPEEAKIQSN